MESAMSDIRYTKEHEWVRVDGATATTGISNHAQEQLGDVVFVELPEVGSTLTQGGAMAVVESVKAASDVYAPISGEVVQVNDALEGDPALINGDAEGNPIGVVTSGGFGPSVGGPIAMGYVASAHAADGTPLTLMVRGKPQPAQVAPTPFVPHRYAR
jgi:glycine cleavage system H protein